MNRYNQYMASHFEGCTLLARTRDPYRNRDVQLRAIPGEFDYVGVTDGTDAWVAPVIGDPFSVNIARLLEDLRQGKVIVVDTVTKRTRHAIPKEVVEEVKAIAPRRAITAPATPVVLRRR